MTNTKAQPHEEGISLKNPLLTLSLWLPLSLDESQVPISSPTILKAGSMKKRLIGRISDPDHQHQTRRVRNPSDQRSTSRPYLGSNVTSLIHRILPPNSERLFKSSKISLVT
jgi:hypothetical protein